MKAFRFHPIDTWFFRQARPMQPSTEARSVFPPSMQTLSGALRGLVGDSRGIDWAKYHADSNDPLRSVIGYRENLDPLSFRGPWISHQAQRLYPLPLCIAQRDGHLFRMAPGNPLHSDLGTAIRFVELPPNAAGAKPIENAWVSQDGMQKILNGGIPELSSIYDPTHDTFPLYSNESRLGIARNNTSRANHNGMLYQTSHIRPARDLAIDIEVRGLNIDLPPRSTIRLGGEGRPAVVEQCENLPSDLIPPTESDHNNYCLILTTPLFYRATTESPLPGFQRLDQESLTVWVGSINGIELEIHSAAVGKILREGGWDLAASKPKIVENLIPAGSTYFIRFKDPDNRHKAHTLHGYQLGERTALGFGEIAVGLWDKEFI